MNNKSTFFWSHLKMYEECPQKFLWTKGWEGIDLGNGAGQKKTPSNRVSRHHAIMGISIHKAIELFYNDEIWREGKKVSEILEKIALAEFDKQLAKSFIDLNSAGMTIEEMKENVSSGIRGFIPTLKHNKLLGKYSKAEQKVLGWIDNYTPLGGYIDIILRKDEEGVILLDGKNAKVREFASEDQLIFYALLFKLSFKTNPDKLGFIWFRYPYSEETGEQGVTWVEFTDDQLSQMSERIKKVKHKMYKKKFEATPSRMACKFCEYTSACQERKDELEVKEISGKGFSDFSL